MTILNRKGDVRGPCSQKEAAQIRWLALTTLARLLQLREAAHSLSTVASIGLLPPSTRMLPHSVTRALGALVRLPLGARLLGAIFCCASIGLSLPGCERFPTNNENLGPGGRSQPLALSPQQELAVGRRAYQQVLDEYQDRLLPDGSVEARRVSAVTARLIRAAEIEPLQREILLRIRGYRFEWEEKVLRSTHVNAFCLPAGKIVVFTGLLRVAAIDDQLATVLGHEMAHALSHHGSERVAREESGSNTLRSLSYDRAQESEADHIGLFLMTFAGYEPEQAVNFWERMHSLETRGRPPEFLSDHPSTEHRIRDLRAWAPKAKAAKKAFDEGRIDPRR